MIKKVRWGILSTAKIAQDELLPSFQKALNAEVAGLASSNPAVYDIADKFGIPTVYQAYEELLEDPNIDAVYIPLPNALHSTWVKKAAEKGKHILCEKPATLTAKETKEMLEVCKNQNVMFMEGFMYQFHPQHTRVKEIIDSGEIGEVKSIRASLSFFLEDQRNNIRMNQTLGGGSLYDAGCYCIHSIRNITNAEPKWIFASAQNDISDQVDMSINGVMELDSGAMATFNAAMDRMKEGQYEIIGTNGSIQASRAFTPHLFNGEAQITVSKENHDDRIEQIYGDQYTLEIEFISNCILEKEMPLSFIEDAICNAKAIDACFESIKSDSKSFIHR